MIDAGAGGKNRLLSTTPRRIAAYPLMMLLSAAAVAASLALGAARLPLPDVWAAIHDFDPENPAHVIVRETRLPRTLVAAMGGAGFAVAGVAMQALIRNPLADPGLLGVNAGASCAVAAAAVLGISAPGDQVRWALAGAFAVSALVMWLGTLTPIRLLLVGVAVTSILTGLTTAATLVEPRAFDLMRGWATGSVDGRGLDVVAAAGPIVGAGILVAFGCARALAAMQLGDESAASLGIGIPGIRLLVVAAVACMAGGVTAAAGPIAFAGLLAAHIARLLVGPDPRRMMGVALFAGAALLIVADVVGRFIVQPAEMPAGLVVAFLGGPLLIALVRRKGMK